MKVEESLMNTLEYVIGLGIEKVRKILDIVDIDFLIGLLANDYDRYIKNDSGTGIVFVSENRVFRIENNIIQVVQKDLNDLYNKFDTIVKIAEYFKAKPTALGFKITGLKKVSEDAYQTVIKDKIFLPAFSDKIANFSDILEGMGIRIVYSKGKWHINHLIEPYYQDKSNIYEQLDGNIHNLGETQYSEIRSEIDNILNIYGLSLLN